MKSKELTGVSAIFWSMPLTLNGCMFSLMLLEEQAVNEVEPAAMYEHDAPLLTFNAFPLPSMFSLLAGAVVPMPTLPQRFKYSHCYLYVSDSMKVMEETVKIVRDGLMGGAARIDGTRIRVRDVVEKHIVLGYSPEGIAEAFNIPLAAVYEALSYYYQHAEEIREEIREDKEFVEEFRKKHEILGR